MVRYKDLYFNADKKQGLHGMLDTAGHDGNPRSESENPKKRTHERRGHGQTGLKLHCLTYDEILVVSERNKFCLCFPGNGDILKCQQNTLLVSVCE